MPNQKIIIANWKMKPGLKESVALAEKVGERFAGFTAGTVAVSPNFISLLEVKKALGKSPVKLGAQNVFWESPGAFTGEIAPEFLVEAGVSYVIIGHSERRKYLNVNYEMIHKTIKAVLPIPELTPVVCLGENWEERKTDRRDFILFDQLQQALSGINVVGDQQVIVAYEPIWAIGSGTAIEPAEAEYAHKIIRLTLNEMFGKSVVANNFRVIYGGSINSKNVSGFIGQENIDGLLVGGASLDADEFFAVATAICRS